MDDAARSRTERPAAVEQSTDREAGEPDRRSADVSAPVDSVDEAIRYFAGTWRAEAENPSTGQSFTLRYEVEPVLAGAWLSGTGTEPELGIEVRDMWGRDAAGGELVRVIFQGDGTHGTVRSAGWRGDTLVFEGQVETADGVQEIRETITRLGPDAFDAVWEARIEGSWTVYSDEHLVRQPSP